MSRQHEPRPRELRYLIQSARSVVNRISDARMAQLGRADGTDAHTTRETWLHEAVRRPRTVLIALGKEPKT